VLYPLGAHDGSSSDNNSDGGDDAFVLLPLVVPLFPHPNIYSPQPFLSFNR